MKRLVVRSSATGAAIAAGIMGLVAARAAWTITRGHRWGDLRKL